MRTIALISPAVLALALGACNSQTIVVEQGTSTAAHATPDASVPPTPSACGQADAGPLFGAPMPYATGPGPWQIAVADVNGDGQLDLVVANGGVAINGPPLPGSSLTILYGHGDGTFPGAETVQTQLGTVTVAAADFSNSGRPDLAVGSCDEADGGAGGAIQLFSVQSNGLFSGDTPYPIAGCPGALATGDFNGDGRIDLAVASPGYFGGDNGVILLFNHGDHVIGPPILYPTAAGQNDVVVADLNGDGWPDVISVGNDSTLNVFLNGGPGTPGELQLLAPALLPGGPFNSIAVADFDADGVLDAALVDTNHGKVALLIGRGDGSFDAPVVVSTPGYPFSVVAADFNGDGLPDLAVAYEGGPFDGVALYVNEGQQTFVGPTEFLTDCCSFAAAAGDFNGDGLPDLAIANNAQSVATILLDECDASAPDAGVPFAEAAHTPLPQVPFNGGPVLPAPQLVTIHYLGDPGQTHNEAYDDWIAGSQWLATVGASYGVSPGVDLAKVVLPMEAPTAMTDADIQRMLVDEIDAGVLPAPAAGDAGYATNLLYMLYLPGQTVVTIPQLGASCQSYGGYHSEDDLGPSRFPYAVLPFCYGDQGFQDVAASHELIEASTDPFPGSAPAYVFDDDTSPWTYYPGEVADLCVDYDLQIDGRDVQRVWSNDAATAGTQPCVPAPAGPYYNVSPAPGNTLQMYAGQSTTFQLTGWSTGATAGPFGIAFEPLYYASNLAKGFLVPEVTFDHLTLQNGEVANMSVTIPLDTPANSFAPFAVYSGRSDDDPNGGYWTFLITVP